MPRRESSVCSRFSVTTPAGRVAPFWAPLTLPVAGSLSRGLGSRDRGAAMWREVLDFVVVFAVSSRLPGPDTMLFSRAMGSGPRAAVTVAVGLTLGKLALLNAAVLGVTAAALALGPLFVVLKVAGGGYLLWTAVALWRQSGEGQVPTENAALTRPAVEGGWRDVALGALLSLSNPQALLFYIAVLPAVLGDSRVGVNEYLLLCAALLVVMAGVACTYIGLATRIRTAISASRRRIADRIGAVLLGVTGAAVIGR